MDQNNAIVVIRCNRHSDSGDVRVLNVEDDDGQGPRVGELDGRIVERGGGPPGGGDGIQPKAAP